MNKRLLDYSASDFLKAKPMELKQAILASEGRTIMAENVPSSCPYMGKSVTNAELERAAGADLILFNALDLFNPQISGVPLTLKENPIIWIKKALGRAIGVNLEPVDKEVLMSENRTEISSGRIVSPETLKKANELGFNFICLTGNPGTGVSNRTIEKAITLSKSIFNGLIIAGKMHGAGVDEPIMNLDIAKRFIKTGVDILLVPAPYT
ncbi:TPA: haloacid dehalogenase-like hydrolase, partial [Enterococcus faecium]|nr:haloacid dehalogenase-like hydrolase [Enterococcus faecium]